MAKDNLVSLPLDPTGQTSSLGNVARKLPDVGSKDPLDTGLSPTEQWLADHPDGAAFNENEPLTPIKTPVPLDTEDEADDAIADQGDADATDTQTSDTSTVAPDVVATEEATPPAPKVAKGQEQPKDVAPAKPAEAPKTYAPEEKLALAEGVEWTRQQVVDALHERVSLQPKAQAADTFQQIFRMDAERAKQVWAPIVERLIAEPQIGAFLDGYLADNTKREYLNECAKYFDETATERGEQPAGQQQQAFVDPVARQQMNELLAWKQQRQERDDRERYEREVEIVRSRYPFVVADPALFNDLRETARYMWSQDSKRGLLDALAAKAPIYDALSIARNAGQSEDESAQPAQAPVATLPSNGAAPGASRRAPKRRRDFADLDEATAAWLAEHPGDFQE